MLLLVSGATRDVGRFPYCGVLVVPKARNRPENLLLLHRRWAMDNGAFGAFDAAAFRIMLRTFAGIPGCIFVAAPDKVGAAAETLALFSEWRGEIAGHGYPVALVAQDGLVPSAVPWRDIGALFIGGTDAFKASLATTRLAESARARGIWLHMGRVNGLKRLRYATRIGCDSVDGSGFSKWPATLLPRFGDWTRRIDAQPELF